MPMYDYSCEHCGESFEELRLIAERHTAPCPRCGETASKVLSGFFTGSSSPAGSADRGSGGCSIGGSGGTFRGG